MSRLRFPLSRLSMRIFSGSLFFSQSAQPTSLKSHLLPRCAATTACLWALSDGDEFVEEPEELVDLLLGKVGVVGGVFDFKSVHVKVASRHDVWQGVEAWVAYGDPNGVVAFLLQKLHQDGFAVEASFAPTTKSYPVDFCTQTACSPRV